MAQKGNRFRHHRFLIRQGKTSATYSFNYKNKDNIAISLSDPITLF
jgi:hypothetical protein